MKLFIFLLSSIVVVSAAELTLHSAQSYLVKNNFDLQIISEDVRKSDAEIAEAKSGLYPLIDVTGAYSYVSEKSKVQMTIPKFGTITSSSGQQDRTEIGADISYPVFTGMSRYYNIKNKETVKNSKDINKRITENRYSFILGLLYIRWSLATQQLDVRKQCVEYMERYADQVKVLHDGGVIVESKVLEAEAKLKAAELDYVLARTQNDSLKCELLGMIGIDDSEFTAEKILLSIDTMDVPDSIVMSRSELSLLDKSIEQLQLTKKISFAQRYPVVSALAGYHIANPGLNSGFGEFMDYFQVGAQVKWNVFDGLKNRNQRAQIEHQITMVQIDKEKNIDQWIRSFGLWKKQIQSAQERISVAEASLAASDAYMHSLESSLKAGVVTDVDYESAVTNYIQAGLQVENAKFSKRLSQLSAIYVSGKDIVY